jgi:hypothetical protein
MIVKLKNKIEDNVRKNNKGASGRRPHVTQDAFYQPAHEQSFRTAFTAT